MLKQKALSVCKICGKETPNYFSVGKANGSQPIKVFYCDEHLQDIYDPVKTKK